ncbi:Tm-1-like ATP-binding domain-containing protein [Halomonas sp.]|uniref:Tm-1-like ATP-binding domain-containing protein n=1 Tax=Halomonas sp. TaxID=1486246 RepID=UPI003A102392
MPISSDYAITRRAAGEGVGAAIGMVEMSVEPDPEGVKSIGMTVAGVTTPCAMTIRDMLEKAGYEVIAFHCNGVGAEAMEDLAVSGKIQGVIDMSPKDIADGLYGGLFQGVSGTAKEAAESRHSSGFRSAVLWISSFTGRMTLWRQS